MLIQTKGKLLAPASKSEQMHLTFRDRRVLHNLAKGLSNRELASELGVSVRTIKYYVSRLFRKMGVHSRFQAILETKRMQLDLSDQIGEHGLRPAERLLGTDDPLRSPDFVPGRFSDAVFTESAARSPPRRPRNLHRSGPRHRQRAIAGSW